MSAPTYVDTQRPTAFDLTHGNQLPFRMLEWILIAAQSDPAELRGTAHLLAEYSDAVVALLIACLTALVAVVWRAATWQVRIDEVKDLKTQVATLQSEGKLTHGRLCALEGEATGPYRAFDPSTKGGRR